MPSSFITNATKETTTTTTDGPELRITTSERITGRFSGRWMRSSRADPP